MGGSTIKAAIVDDHQELAEYHSKYTTSPPPEQQKWANQYMWELARHTVAEELVLYPAFERHLGALGKEVTARERGEHQVQKELQYRLERMGHGHAEYNQVFDRLQQDLAEHVIEEEATIDKLEAVLSKAENEALTQSLEQTKKFVPTRAHPGTAQAPPFETVEALLLAPVDHLKDLFASWPTKEEKKAA
ncbi:hypothetical protein CALVIDRAFT_568128 [Calocera viscosa TUFC12733]|uniref:Hemerythrin-like domain-containing protein n=1 Tax=Calocera viscosa (strain TUFC12733) TaxID=1330018 RepID=A0A167HF45_CALVF|nr:hypothetical protein CALVIDRAFT_568128 [Calocera viscosa TUFC12733]